MGVSSLLGLALLGAIWAGGFERIGMVPADRAWHAWRPQDASPVPQNRLMLAPATAETAGRAPDMLRAVLYKGSFAGTRPVGDWCVDTNRRLSPCSGLRDRFEYYISGLGEISASEVRSLIEDEAQRAHGHELAAQIMIVYDRYWSVRNHESRNRVDMRDVSTWMPALQEVQALRKQILGEAWAQAFFEEDDRLFLETYQRASLGLVPKASPHDPVPLLEPGRDPEAVRSERIERYGAEAAERLAALDVQQQQFDRHVSLARAEWSRLQTQSHLSDQHKQEQLRQFIAEHFDSVNQRRAMILAKLPPA